MSQAILVAYRNTNFWAYDVAVGIFLTQESISAHEMEAWDLLDGEGVFARGASQFPTATVVELGRAIQALLSGTLPPAPEGTWWFYGVETGRSTIKKRS